MYCPICFQTSTHIFKNVCSHIWCKSCQLKLIQHNLTTCPICRHEIFLKKQLNTPEKRILWALNGGKVLPRWIKKYKKHLQNNTDIYI